MFQTEKEIRLVEINLHVHVYVFISSFLSLYCVLQYTKLLRLCLYIHCTRVQRSGEMYVCLHTYLPFSDHNLKVGLPWDFVIIDDSCFSTYKPSKPQHATAKQIWWSWRASQFSFIYELPLQRCITSHDVYNENNTRLMLVNFIYKHV